MDVKNASFLALRDAPIVFTVYAKLVVEGFTCTLKLINV